jgi:membrane associated rhomboid family serine protease
MARRTTTTDDPTSRWVDTAANVDGPLTRPSESRAAREGLKAEAKLLATSLGGTLAVLWAVQLVNFLGGQWLNTFGILPRTLSGLVGILTWPFLHGGWLHLISNTIGILTIGVMVLLRDRTHFWRVAILGTLLGGVGVWLFGRSAFHVGASGVLFAWLGYLLTTGIFERRIVPILTSVVAFVFFGGMLWGVLPTMPGVSFEGHLFGFIAGVISARILARESRTRRQRKLPS